MSECPKCRGDESRRPCEYCGAGRRIPPGHVGVVDPPPVPLHAALVCDQHGPTVRVEWASGDRCPLCESYESERRMATEGILRRVAEAAYRCGTTDMRHRAAKVACNGLPDNARMSRVVADIYTLNPVQTEPDWTGMIRLALEEGR